MFAQSYSCSVIVVYQPYVTDKADAAIFSRQDNKACKMAQPREREKNDTKKMH